jgi:hypothetical protein
MTTKKPTKKKTTAAAKPAVKKKPKPLDNMHLWEELCETDPDYTKEVGFRGGFTSIDPQWQILRMTETFGPCGKGWGFEEETDRLIIDPDNIIHETKVNVWWRDESDQIRYLGAVPTAAMYMSDGRIDLDAPKKAQTDALTKSFSRLGLSADVFLGMFDDPSYVQELKDKKDGPATETQVQKVVAIGKLKGEEWVEQVCKHFAIDSLEDIKRSQAERVLERMAQESQGKK